VNKRAGVDNLFTDENVRRLMLVFIENKSGSSCSVLNIFAHVVDDFIEK